MVTTTLAPGPTDTNGTQPHPVKVHYYEDTNEWQLFIGHTAHGPRYSARMSKAEIRRIAYAILSATEEN